MKQVAILGASGYTGAQLVKLISAHPAFSLSRAFVSAGSTDAGKSIGDLHGALSHLAVTLEALTEDILSELADTMDFIFLATPHEASHDWMPVLTGSNARVLDLSGAFRIKDTDVFSAFYGFEHTAQQQLKDAVYGLADWYPDAIAAARLIAVPGCYPTASLTALKPLAEANLLDTGQRPVVNAVSGVSGAGRKASMTTSFCEVSLQAYGVLHHRHTPEIEAYLGTPVIFTPHLGNFKRGILATVTVKLQNGTSKQQVQSAFSQAYAASPIVRLREQGVKLDDVVGSPFADVCAQVDEQSGFAVITCAIDNLLKGAASQAVQCANLMAGLPVQTGLTGGTSHG